MKIFVDLSYIPPSTADALLRAKVYTSRGWTTIDGPGVPTIWARIKPLCKSDDKLYITAENLGAALYDLAKADGFRVTGIKCTSPHSLLTKRTRHTIAR